MGIQATKLRSQICDLKASGAKPQGVNKGGRFQKDKSSALGTELAGNATAECNVAAQNTVANLCIAAKMDAAAPASLSVDGVHL